MDKMKNKILLIKRILDEIESEYDFTSCLKLLSTDSNNSSKEFAPEIIYFNLISLIIECDDVPSNISCVTIRVDKFNNIKDYDILCTTYSGKSNQISFKIIFLE